ncbi:MAG TPA: GFA family protein [Solimonas sp.]|nr:GFA family protein [Solimonas sp.]
MKQTYRGSCHCGAVRFEADIDLSQPTYRCNCSICRRNRFWPAIVLPEDFRLLAGEGAMTQYLFNSMRNQHWFCRRCGVRPYGIGHTPEGQRIYGVNLGCLDDVSDAELAAAPVTYVDGRDDRWHMAPAETRHL